MSAPTQFAIMDDFDNKVVGMAGTYEKALEAAEAHVAEYKPSLLKTLRKEKIGLRNRGKANAGRFFTAMAEKEVYLEVYLFEAQHNYKLDRNGVVRVGR